MQAPPDDQRTDLLSRLFYSTIALGQFQLAYGALIRFNDKTLQRSGIRELVMGMVAKGAIHELLAFAFPPYLSQEVDKIITARTRLENKALTTSSGREVPWFKVLYAWRVSQGNFRGAAGVLVERLETFGDKRRSSKIFNGGSKALSTRLDEYLVGINALALVGDDEGEQGWVFVENEGGK